MTSFNINLELFEKNQTTKECIRFNEKVLKKLKINTDKLELVDSADAYTKAKSLPCELTQKFSTSRTLIDFDQRTDLAACDVTDLFPEVPGQQGHGLHQVKVIGQLPPHLTRAVGQTA